MVELHYIKDSDDELKHVRELKLKHNYSFGLLPMMNYALDGETITNQDNFKYDNFTSDTATIVYNLDYDSGNDWYETINWASSTIYWCDIYATSISSISDWEINGCKMIPMSSGVWRLYFDDSSTVGKARGRVMQTFFLGTGADTTTARLNATYVTGVTNLKVSDSNDVGKKAYFVQLSGSFGHQNTAGGSGRNFYRVDTFDNSDTNSYAQVWTYCYGSDVTTGEFQLPTGTVVNSGGPPSDELGTDTDSEIASNPASIKMHMKANSCWYNTPLSCGANAIVLCVGTMTQGTTVNSGGNVQEDIFDTQFQAFPAFELSDFSDTDGYIITDSKALSGSETAAIVKALASITSGSLKIEVSFDNQAHWTEVTDKELAKIHYSGTLLYLKFTIQRGDNSEIDYISDYAMYYG